MESSQAALLARRARTSESARSMRAVKVDLAPLRKKLGQRRFIVGREQLEASRSPPQVEGASVVRIGSHFRLVR